jgi:hypothetical protein
LFIKTNEDYEKNLRRADELLMEFNKRRTITEGLLSGRMKPIIEEEDIKLTSTDSYSKIQNIKHIYTKDLKMRIDPDLSYLELVLRSRIKRILDVAYQQKVEVLIL